MDIFWSGYSIWQHSILITSLWCFSSSQNSLLQFGMTHNKNLEIYFYLLPREYCWLLQKATCRIILLRWIHLQNSLLAICSWKERNWRNTFIKALLLLQEKESHTQIVYDSLWDHDAISFFYTYVGLLFLLLSLCFCSIAMHFSFSVKVQKDRYMELE